ncbi:putative clathrin heavy chain [Rhizoctonia solani AG-1 IB]|uniref:Putative clathrin heavy chain n=1 Tax=Thanatephorus cucumeris (strain AG1-IB / isolate 7/3/14) TaxID=1108050 RepID=M5BPZ7_THACB|nr:putative clathrin heavy chain [Rhizoctonia solani AG-1 IB]
MIHRVQKNKRWEESLSLSKQDKLYKDAIQTASISGSTEVAEELISYFVDIGNKECFAAMLYACFDLLRPDIIMELSWHNGLNDFYVPYQIQIQRQTLEKIATLEKEVKEQTKKTQTREQQEADQPIINPGGFGNQRMITAGPGMGAAPPMYPNGLNGGMHPQMTGYGF